MASIVLNAEHICKTFYRKRSSYGLKDVILHSFTILKHRHDQKSFTVLDDVSLSIRQGESLAVLGRNGAGKSTLLSLLSGIIPPTSGSIETSGRIGLLLELGSGFCHDLSGRENILLNGLLLGATRKELEENLDRIIDFSGIRDFIDEPLRTYSTGMQTRLGFSIAVHIRPALMLIDEVLAVGDSEFRRKCLQKLLELKESGVAFLLVTHSLEDAELFCEQAIYLDGGKVRFSGETAQVLNSIRSHRCEY